VTAILEGRGVTKRFGGVRAVSGVDFAVEAGEIFGIIGPNGAGKTTLMNLISRLAPLSEGEILFKGQPLSRVKPHAIARLGIARTFQIVRPFPGLTVRENVAIGPLFGRAGTRAGIAECLRRADVTLDLVGLGGRRDAPVTTLTLAGRKRLELARALATDPEVLLLDEVMAGLNRTEVAEVAEIVRDINRRGVTIVVIEHVMEVIMGISRRILVLHHGERIALGSPADVAQDGRVITAYLGTRYGQRAGSPA
jgi:branched-chain amino acid transport system ATP-binding protein